MNLIIYTCCQSEDCIFGSETEWLMDWSDTDPQLGSAASMGAKARWNIVKITVYRPETAQEIDGVFLAYLHPIGKPIPPDSEWDSELVIDFPQTLYAEIVAPGKQELRAGPIESGYIPTGGEQTESYLNPTEGYWAILEQPKSWTTWQVVTYTAVLEMRLTTPETTSYGKAFVCWCEPTETTVEA